MPRTTKSKEKYERKKRAKALALRRKKQHPSDRKDNTSKLFKAFEFDEITSPIRHLIRHAKNLAAKISPKKREIAEQYCKDVTLKITNEGTWVNHYDPNTKTIVFSKKLLEIIWVCSHMYVTFFTDVVQAKKLLRLEGEPKVIIDLNAIPSVVAAADLLDWIFSDWLDEKDTAWPAHLMRPIPDPLTDSPQNWADELTLCAIAFLLHHELAHHYLKHGGEEEGFETIQRERQADYSSADFLLSGLQPGDNFFIKKSMAIAVVLSIRIAYAIKTGKWGGDSHPRCFDRIVHVLDRYIDSENRNHSAWTFAWSIIYFHLIDSPILNKLNLDNLTEISHRGLLDLYLEAFSQLEEQSE